ncbi:glutathione S-transferase [Caenimonas koreensis DSM 17982]|uniref:Glutathione S-transferase n=1 Tax=Caenimonas koreensis DSM 17982 TaxID=1121255 RepID=A0A844AUU1_9BURK|nr:glutathione S-transferase [Caenimonas koreensis]MRD48280.1 glutathione S-transferase [Caenimonas koreensis DSM 17982]
MTAPKPQQPIRLHTLDISGHCHRVEMFLAMLDLPYELVTVDMMKGAHKRPEFLALNPFGQVPVIEDGDVVLADSNAILVYLESKYGTGQWLPRDPLGAARVQRWLSAAAGLLAFGPAAARAAVIFKRPDDPAPALARATRLLDVMELELKDSPFLVNGQPTLADVALYSYVARAPEGNISLEPYPNVRAWLARIEALPRFVPMVVTKVGMAA